MQSRYPTSKLLNLFFARELASRLPKDSPLIINAVNPNLCVSGLRRNLPLSSIIIFWFWDLFVSWPTERGSRQLIFAALGNKENPAELNGSYISSSKLTEPSDYVISDEGIRVQKQLWVRSSRRTYSFPFGLITTQHETSIVLSKVSPNIQSILSSNNLL